MVLQVLHHIRNVLHLVDHHLPHLLQALHPARKVISDRVQEQVHQDIVLQHLQELLHLVPPFLLDLRVAFQMPKFEVLVAQRSVRPKLGTWFG